MIVIARHEEDVIWTKSLKEPFFVVQKGEHVENIGREASSYLWWIIGNYEDLPEKVTFLQGNPWDHQNEDLTPKWITDTNQTGEPHHPGLSIGPLAFILGLNLDKEWKFPTGAQFTVTKEEILKRPLTWYMEAYRQSMNYPQAAWCFERLWPVIFKFK